MTTQYSQKNPETIKQLFGSVASQYDKTNSMMSFNLHRYWNQRLIRFVMEKTPSKILDLCCGTGEIGLGLYKRNPCDLTLLDFCKEMLDCAKAKSVSLKIPDKQLTFVQGDAQETGLPDSTFDAITVAYGIRNVESPERCMREALRLLKPGGTFAILELTCPTNRVLQMGHKLYLQQLVPLLGKWTTSNKQAYEYLCRSIQDFIDPKMAKVMLLDVGFQSTLLRPIHGGIATIIAGEKRTP